MRGAHTRQEGVLSLLAASLVLAQSPQVQCLTANGNAACARTPWGRCIATNGQVFCGDPSWETLRVLEEPPPVECLTTNGTAACGYDCKRANGRVACAQTPWGRCVTANGDVFCGDPAPWVVRTGQASPVECLVTNGTAACGYGCQRANGHAACAQTPWGRCVATNGELFCSDPPPWVVRRGAPPPMQCVTTNGTGACGYDCKTANGRAACAHSPWGRCVTANGNITCSD